MCFLWHQRALYIAALCLLVGSAAHARPRNMAQEKMRQYEQLIDTLAQRKILRPIALTCDVPLCELPETRALLLTLATPPAGEELTAQTLVGIWSRLMKTGYFADVDIRVKATDRETVSLEIQGTGVVQIARIDVRYDGLSSWLYPKQFIAEIRKRLPLRKGGPFPPRRKDGSYSPKDDETIQNYAKRIKQLYEEQGFQGTRVRIKPTYFGEGNRLVNVVIRVREGDQPAMGQVLIYGGKAYPYWRIVDAFSTGEQIDLFQDTFGVFGYGRYGRRTLKTEAGELEEQYKEDGYFAAKVRLESKTYQRNGVIHPRVRISEGPKVSVTYEGNRSLSDAVLDKVLTFRSSGAMDGEEIEQSRRAILQEYQSVARYYADVDAEVVERTSELVQLRFVIDEGPRVFVRSVKILGADFVPADELRELMLTKGVAPNGVINSLYATDGVLQDANVINDLNAIKAHYASLGVPDVYFRCAPPKSSVKVWTALGNFEPDATMPGPQSVEPITAGKMDLWSANPVQNHCFRVAPTSDPRLVDVVIELREGRRISTGKPNVTEVIMYNMDEQMREEAFTLLQELGFLDEFRRWNQKVGLNTKKIKAIQGFLLRFYHQEGYLAATVIPKCTIGYPGDDDPRLSCDAGRLYGTHVQSLRFDVKKGPKTRTAGILLRGNLRTSPGVIDNELRMETGQALGSDEIFLSQANLRSLGIFDAVNVEYISHPLPQRLSDETESFVRDATVVVSVEESKAKSLDLYLGVQVDSAAISDELPVLYTLGGSIRDRNFWGKGLELGLGLNHANRIDDPLDYRGDDALWQAGPFLKNRRFLGTRLDLTTEALYQLSETAQRDAYQEVINLDTTVGYDFYALSYPAKWGQGLRSTLSTELRRERLRELSRGGERPTFGEATNSLSLSPALTWDQRDSPLHPTRGFYVSASVEFLVPNVRDASDFPTKLMVTSHYVRSFLKRQLIVVPNIKLGSVWTGRGEDDLKANFLFKAGGDGVTIPVRGYTNASIDACNGSETRINTSRCSGVYPEGVSEGEAIAIPSTIGGHAMIAGGLELRFPTFAVDDLWATIFSDFAAVSPYWGTLGPESLYPSVGGGFRYLVTGQIPLRLDFAYPLRENVFSTRDLRVHVNIFYTL